MKVGSIIKQVSTRALVTLLVLVAIVSPLGAANVTAQDADPLATRVQFLHAATDVGDVEVHINNNNELDEFAYGDVSEWIDIDPGTARVTITADRTGFNYVIFDAVYPVPAGNDYYVDISDALILAGAFDTSALPADTGRVQVTHASINSPAVNIAISGSDTTIPLSYPRTSDALEVPVGTYDFDIQLEETGESIAMVTGFTVEAGTSYQLVAVGDPTSDDKPVEVKVLESDAISSEASPEASPVS